MTWFGWLSTVFTVICLSFGAVPREFGFHLALNLSTREILFTPIVALEIKSDSNAFSWWGVTIAGVVLESGVITSDRWRYELEHVPLWEHFGVTYPLYAFVEPCDYDPRAMWARCSSHYQRLINPYSLPPTTAAFVIHF